MRSTTLDLIRIVAIYLVVVVHTFQFPIDNSQLSLINLVFYALAKTCVPLFLLLSGGLLLAKKEHTQQFFRKRFMKVLLPWIGWTLLAVLIASFRFGQPITWNNFTNMLQSFWFVVLIFCLYIITPVLSTMVQALQKPQLIYLVVLWFLTVSLFPFIYDSLAFPMSVDNGLVRQTISYSGLYIGGYLLLHPWKNLLKQPYLLGAFLFGLGLLLNVGLTLQAQERTGVVTDNFFNFYAPGAVLCSVGLFLVLHKSLTHLEKVVSQKARAVIGVISTLSLHIYFLHDILRRFVFQEIGSPHFMIAYGQGLALFVFAVIILLLVRTVTNLRK